MEAVIRIAGKVAHNKLLHATRETRGRELRISRHAGR